MPFIPEIQPVPGGVNETARLVAEILDAAPSPREPLPEHADGFTVVQQAQGWVATHDGRPS